VSGVAVSTGAASGAGAAAAAAESLVPSSVLAELLQAVKANAAIAMINNFFIFILCLKLGAKL
jgi:hypothetical protein